MEGATAKYPVVNSVQYLIFKMITMLGKTKTNTFWQTSCHPSLELTAVILSTKHQNHGN